MAIHGKATGVIYGTFDITKFLKDITVNQSTETVDSTPFQTQDKTYVIGMADATVTVGGFYEGSLPATKALFEDAAGQDTDTPFLVGYGGWKPGNRVRMGVCQLASFDVSGSISDLVAISGGMQADGGLRGGFLLDNLNPVTAATTGATQDGGAASTRGGRLQVHVPANTRTAAAVVTVQHSTNGTTWVDLQATPIPLGTTGAFVYAIAGTINRYVRVISTLTAGTGQLVYTAALARNA